MMTCIFFGLGGLLLGSFLNVCIIRLPAGESIVFPGSHCRLCRAPIAKRDNIPVVSWLLLLGKCRACRGRISWRYPLIELLTCLLFVMCCLRFPWWPGVGWAYLCFLLLGLAVTDAETLLLPDWFTLPGLVAGVLFNGVLGGLLAWSSTKRSVDWTGAWNAARHALLAAGAAAGVLLLIALIYWVARRRSGLGLGDVKLLAMLAAWLGVPRTALILFLAVIVGALYGVTVMMIHRRRAKGLEEEIPLGQLPIPFGTMLCLAGFYAIFLGQRTLDWYGQFFR